MDKGKSTKKNTKFITKIILIIFILLAFIAVGLFLMFNSYNHAHMSNQYEFGLVCDISDEEYSDSEELTNHNDNIKKDEILDCYLTCLSDSNILKERVNNKINELWFSIAEGKGADENERLAINSINSKWTINYKDNYAHIVSKSDNSSLEDIRIKYKVRHIDKDGTYINDDFIYRVNGDSHKYNASFKSNTFNTFNYRTTFDKKDNAIKFYELDDNYSFKFVNEFKLDTVVNPSFDMNYNEGIALINNSDSIYLYSVKSGVLQKYQPFSYNLYKNGKTAWSNLGDLIYVYNAESNKYGIVDIYGNVVHDFSLNRTHSIGHGSGILIAEEYSIVGDAIIDKKDEKFALLKIYSNEKITDYIYDDIVVLNENYFAAKKGDIWNVYSISSGDKIIDNDYELILAPTDNILIVQKEGYLYFIDYSGNILTSNDGMERIPVLAPYMSIWQSRSNFKNSGIKYEVKDNAIYIDTYYTNESGSKSIHYIYNIENNVLSILNTK